MIFHTHVEHSPTKTIYIKYLKNKTNKKRTTNTIRKNEKKEEKMKREKRASFIESNDKDSQILLYIGVFFVHCIHPFVPY